MAQPKCGAPIGRLGAGPGGLGAQATLPVTGVLDEGADDILDAGYAFVTDGLAEDDRRSLPSRDDRQE